MKIKTHGLALSFLGLVFGCTRPAETQRAAQGDIVADRLITIPPSAISSAPVISLSPDLELGGGRNGTADAFGRIGAVGIDSKGGIYVLDNLAGSVVKYGATGQLIKAFGTKGEGPGEFQHAARLVVDRDTVLVQGWKVTAFDTSGAFLTESRTSTEIPLSQMLAHTPDGVALRRRLRGLVSETMRDDTLMVYLLKGDRLVRQVSAVERVFIYGGMSEYPVILTPGILLNVAPSGRMFTVVGDSFHINIHSPNGPLQTTIAAKLPRVKRHEQDLADFTKTLQRKLREELKVSTQLPDFESLGPLPDHRPVIGAMLVSEEDRILVQRLDIADRPYQGFVDSAKFEWLLLSSDGVPQVRVQLPASLTPLLLRRCTIYGKMDKADGTPIVARYPIPPKYCAPAST